MKNYAPLLSACAFLILGLSVAAAGVAKEEPYSVLDGHDSVYFGNKDSNVSVYIFTDWFCPACRKVEPALDKQLPEIMKKARVVFVDTVIHENSLNYLPYNLSFMMKEKDKYLTLRQKLTKMAKSDNEPTEAKIEELAKTSGVKYHELPYAEVQQGIKYFEKLQKNYSIESTPAIVIVNTKTNKGKKLTTVEQIAEADIPALVEKLAK